MKKTFVFSCLALIALLFTSSGAYAQLQGDEAAIQACIVKNIRATQKEDLDAYWETCKPPAQVKQQTEAMMKTLFETYDLSYRINSYKLLSKDDNSATVELVITTKKISGPEFKDNQSTSEYTLTKTDGNWFITGFKMKSVVIIGEEEPAAETSANKYREDTVVEPGDETAIRTCVLKNVLATQNENIDALWETCKPASDQEKKQTEAALKLLFENYDLEYKIHSYKLISCDGNNAAVEVVMTTKKVNGPEFKNYITRCQHDLKKIDGKWYLVGSKVLNIKYLD